MVDCHSTIHVSETRFPPLYNGHSQIHLWDYSQCHPCGSACHSEDSQQVVSGGIIIKQEAILK